MLPFAKYSGAGNDFVLIREDLLQDMAADDLARWVCSRTLGVCVDGLILVGKTEGGIRVRFFNPDGSEFGTCGNGTRCAALYACDEDLVPNGPFGIETADGWVRASVSGRSVELGYEIPAEVVGEHTMPGPGGATTAGWLVRIGTPHFVLPLEVLPTEDIGEICRPIRTAPEFGEHGTNVNLVTLSSSDRARIRTFERGVEGETMACGSGCMAAALALFAAERCGRTLHLSVRGGDTLTVTLPEDLPVGARSTSRIGLAGGAQACFRGTLPPRDRGV
ncbi:MAG: diaminopimelate epimerase [Gemmatimonadota bacterium]